MTRNLKRRRPDLDPARLDRTARLMIEHLPDALVTGYEALVPAMTNHEGDRHVLAAAVRGGAQVIITWNGEHSSSSACDPYSVDVQTPDEFLCHLWHLAPESMAQVLKEQVEHLIKPPQTPLQLVATLGKSVPEFAKTALQSGLLDLPG